MLKLRSRSGRRGTTSKGFEKTQKKVLTNAGRCGKIIKLSRGAARTLKIEQELTSKETLKFFESNSKHEWTKAKAKFVQKSCLGIGN